MKTDIVLISLAILGSSFWGSWHCAAMCGPMASLAARRKSLSAYHIGRGLGYVLLGVLGGYIGSFFLTNEFQFVRVAGGIFFACLLILMGIQTWRGNQSWISPQFKFLHSLFNRQQSGFFMGLLSLFLPCGWLYTYVLAAVTTQSAWTGGYIMALFWVAGLPALSALSLFMKKTIQVAPERKKMIAGMVLVCAGLYSLISFYFLNSHHH